MMREKVLEFLQQEIDAQHIPGAVIHVSHQGEVLMQNAIGDRSLYPARNPMSIDTVFDIASLTKVVATLPAVLRLLEKGELHLDDPVHYFISDFKGGGKEGITIKHLLTHTSGLPSHRPYHLEQHNASQIIESVCVEELSAPIEERIIYSDLNFILLYHIIEQITNKPFPEFVSEEIFKPLGMNETMFLPHFSKERFAPTEYFDHIQDYKCGVVHDENAESMGGVSGHAGLFSTIDDLAKYCLMIEREGLNECSTFLSKVTLKLTRRNFTPYDPHEFRGLGWILKGPKQSSCGDLFSTNSYGHTGFTGTSIWFDPDEELHVILLTNRVHLGRKSPIIRLRSRLHNIIRASL